MSTEVQKLSGVSLERPAFLKKNDRTGTEHIGKDDLRLPRLALAQGLTPQVAEQKEGFTTGVMFNSLDETIYGKGPIPFVILRGDRPRFVQFAPREAGGGIIDPDVKAGDPRTKFTTNEKGERVKPVATKFYDFIIAMLPLGEDPMKNVISLSFKGAGLKMAMQLNTLITYRNAPLFAGVYALTSKVEKNTQGIFNVFNVENAGWVTDPAMYEVVESMSAALAKKVVSYDRTGEEHTPDGETDFPPVPGDREPGADDLE